MWQWKGRSSHPRKPIAKPIDDTRCLTIQRLIGRFRQTGKDVEGSWGAIVTVRNGKVLRAQGYATPRKTRRAAGLE